MGVNAFWVKSQGDKSFLVILHFYEQVFQKFVWGCPISSHYPNPRGAFMREGHEGGSFRNFGGAVKVKMLLHF